jgi:hypothetical protein
MDGGRPASAIISPLPVKRCGRNYVLQEKTMHVHLDYESGQSFSQSFHNFKIKVSGGGTKRVHISFRETGDSKAYLSFSLPKEKHEQIAHAILTASAGVDQPIEFSFEEPKSKVTAA